MSAKPVLSDVRVEREAEAARDLLAIVAEAVEDDDQARVDMVEGETGLLEAIGAALDEITECEITDAGCAEAIKKLTSRQSRAKARAERVRAAIERAMATTELDKLKLPTCTVTLARRPGKPVVTEEADIPAAYWKPQPPKIDMKAIGAALKSGEAIPGAHMGNGYYSLTIRRA